MGFNSGFKGLKKADLTSELIWKDKEKGYIAPVFKNLRVFHHVFVNH